MVGWGRMALWRVHEIQEKMTRRTVAQLDKTQNFWLNIDMVNFNPP